MAGAYGAKLVEKTPRVADIVSFRFKRPEAYQFQAGQWFTIAFPSPDPEEPWEHHFSHSDSPTEPWLEFTTRLRGSDFKNALDALPIGSQVQIEGPYGMFVLPADAERVAFLCGGIGITCVRSILRWVCDTRAPALKEAVLFFSNRSEDSIPFKAELEEFVGRIPGFRVVHVISQPGEMWAGDRGHIDQAIVERELGGQAGWLFMASGPPAFGQTMRDMLLAWGVEDERIKTERFIGY